MAAAAPEETAPSGEVAEEQPKYKIGEKALDPAAALNADAEDEAMRR